MQMSLKSLIFSFIVNSATAGRDVIPFMHLQDEDTPHVTRDEAANPMGRSLRERTSKLEALWDRPAYRMRRFNLTAEPGEHPCWAGFKSMMRDTDRCKGWQRSYVPKGQKQTFYNTGASRSSNFTLEDVVADQINVWLEENSTDVHRDVAVKAAEIYTNALGAVELKPTEDTASWMEQECKVMGQMPFMYSCSNKINVLVQKCGFDNAFVMFSDYLVNYPAPVNNKSESNNDIIFYLCTEMVDGNPNPYALANTFAHELAHVIQGGFGQSSGVMMEGGATWLEGNLLNLAPRPMIYAWGFRDWNRINAAHIYAETKQTNARKFYQIHAMLLTYLSQDELLGDQGSSALQNYETFNQDITPFGRRTYDYFLQFVGKDRPKSFAPRVLEVNSVEHPFGEVLLNFRVALASQCIVDPSKRPSDPRYLMPENLRDRPFWDCTSFPTFSPEVGSASHEGMNLHYGGAAMYRLALPRDATIRMDPKADWQVRTKVLAAGTGSGPAEVRELRPGDEVTFRGDREIFVVQVNVDPEGETLSREDKGNVWHQVDCEWLKPGCVGKAWTVNRNGFYPSLAAEGLRSPMMKLPKEAKNISLSFQAWWRLEAVEKGFISKTAHGCELDGWDGVQVRVHIYSDPNADHHANGDEVIVLEPHGGYDNRTDDAVAAFGNSGISAPYSNSYRSDCKSKEGWTGSSGENFTLQQFSLQKYAGQHARIEVVFASDAGTVMSGFWMKDFQIRGDDKVGRCPSKTLAFSGSAASQVGRPETLTSAPWMGSTTPCCKKAPSSCGVCPTSAPSTSPLSATTVDWEVFVHYSTGRSFSKGLLLVDKSLGERRQVLELTSETCRWRSKMGEHGEWTPVEKPMPVFMADGVDFVTAFNLSSTGRKNGQMDVRFMMNSKFGIKRVATLKISCKPGHYINSKLRLDKTFLKEKVRGQISPGRRIISDKKKSGNISETLTEMRRMSSLQMMQDQEFFVDDSWVNVGGSNQASLYLSEVDEQVAGERSLVTTCSEQAEDVAKKTCMKWMGESIINATGHLRDSFTDCIFDVCAGGGEAAAELAAEIMEEDDY